VLRATPRVLVSCGDEIPTTMAGGPGFRVVRFDKLKGTEAGWIPFTERRPRYAIDSVAGRVFVRTGDAELAAYAFIP
jgi:hypothetical protein